MFLSLFIIPFPLFFPEKNSESVTYEPTPKHSLLLWKSCSSLLGRVFCLFLRAWVLIKSLAPPLISSHTPCSGQPLLPMRVCLKMFQRTFSAQSISLCSCISHHRKERSLIDILQRDTQHSPSSLSKSLSIGGIIVLRHGFSAKNFWNI